MDRAPEVVDVPAEDGEGHLGYTRNDRFELGLLQSELIELSLVLLDVVDEDGHEQGRGDCEGNLRWVDGAGLNVDNK